MSKTLDHGVVNISSKLTVVEATKRLVEALTARNMMIFAQIDQQAAAHSVDLEMSPMVLILFGSPKVGTPLMQQHPSLAIDLPLKVLLWEDSDGWVWVSYNSSEYLQQRHGLEESPFKAVEAILAEVFA